MKPLLYILANTVFKFFLIATPVTLLAVVIALVACCFKHFGWWGILYAAYLVIGLLCLWLAVCEEHERRGDK